MKGNSDMNTSQKVLTLSLAVAALTACGGSDKATTPAPTADTSPNLGAQIQALEASGQLPKLDRSTDIKGPDTDNNGIRDDIDAWIAVQPITDEQKKAARQMARAQQATLMADLTDKAALDQLGDRTMRGVDCLADSFEPDYQKGLDLSNRIEAITANTKERTKQYIAYNRAASGSVTELAPGNNCEP